jgi:hypothetical protein
MRACELWALGNTFTAAWKNGAKNWTMCRDIRSSVTIAIRPTFGHWSGGLV